MDRGLLVSASQARLNDFVCPRASDESEFNNRLVRLQLARLP